MLLTATICADNGESLGVLELEPKTFSSGKGGYLGQARIEIGGVRYEVQVQLVYVGEYCQFKLRTGQRCGNRVSMWTHGPFCHLHGEPMDLQG